jgi:hypothetical protein
MTPVAVLVGPQLPPEGVTTGVTTAPGAQSPADLSQWACEPQAALVVQVFAWHKPAVQLSPATQSVSLLQAAGVHWPRWLVQVALQRLKGSKKVRPAEVGPSRHPGAQVPLTRRQDPQGVPPTQVGLDRVQVGLLKRTPGSQGVPRTICAETSVARSRGKIRPQRVQASFDACRMTAPGAANADDLSNKHYSHLAVF